MDYCTVANNARGQFRWRYGVIVLMLFTTIRLIWSYYNKNLLYFPLHTSSILHFQRCSSMTPLSLNLWDQIEKWLTHYLTILENKLSHVNNKLIYSSNFCGNYCTFDTKLLLHSTIISSFASLKLLIVMHLQNEPGHIRQRPRHAPSTYPPCNLKSSESSKTVLPVKVNSCVSPSLDERPSTTRWPICSQTIKITVYV